MYLALLAVIYLSFISLGLPDTVLGSAWPLMHTELRVGIAHGGLVSMTISLMTVVSSLLSDRINQKLHAGIVTFVSTLMTAVALWGFSLCTRFWMLLLWAIPYGLGAGSVDAALNNYVAIHYKSSHMSWLHCMWGIGASLGPVLMGFALSRRLGWQGGYRLIAILQGCFTLVLVLSLRLWMPRKQDPDSGATAPGGHLRNALKMHGAVATLACFFCYSTLENCTGVWAASYLVQARGIDAMTAAKFASLFYLGITLGRALCGFIAMRLSDEAMIKAGSGIALAGILCILQPVSHSLALLGLVTVGLGCAPIYPSLIHLTPRRFGAENSQAMVGMQMASAYIGSTFFSPLFAFLAKLVGFGLYPYYLLAVLALMILMETRALSSSNTGRSIPASGPDGHLR